MNNKTWRDTQLEHKDRPIEYAHTPVIKSTDYRNTNSRGDYSTYGYMIESHGAVDAYEISVDMFFQMYDNVECDTLPYTKSEFENRSIRHSNEDVEVYFRLIGSELWEEITGHDVDYVPDQLWSRHGSVSTRNSVSLEMLENTRESEYNMDDLIDDNLANVIDDRIAELFHSHGIDRRLALTYCRWSRLCKLARMANKPIPDTPASLIKLISRQSHMADRLRQHFATK